MAKFLVMVEGELYAMYPNEHFSVEAKDHDDAAQIALVLHNHNAPETGLHLLENEGDNWTKWSHAYTVVSEPCPSQLLPDEPTEADDDAFTTWLEAHEVGSFMIVGPLKEQ